MAFLDALGAIGGGAADSFRGGMDNRAALIERQRAQEAAERLARAKAGVANQFMQQPPDPGAGMMQGTNLPMQMPPGPMGIPGPGPMPQPPMPGQASLPSNGAPPLPPGPVSMMPPEPAALAAPAPQVGAGPAPVPGPAAAPAADGLSGAAAPTGNFFQDSQKTMQNIFSSIQKANPDMDPETAFDAVAQQIEMMKGVDDSSRIYMQASVAQAKLDAAFQIQASKAENAVEVAELRAESTKLKAEIAAQAARDVAGIRGETARDVATTGYQGRVDAAEIGAEGRKDVAGIQSDARRYTDDKKYQGLVYDNVIKAYVEADKARVNADARVDASGAMVGKPPRTPAYNGPARKPGVTVMDGDPAKGGKPIGKPSAPAGAGYKSLGDLQTAFRAGKVSAAEAQAIAKRNGWAR